MDAADCILVVGDSVLFAATRCDALATRLPSRCQTTLALSLS